MRGREGESVVSFRLPLVICEPRLFGLCQIAKFVVKLTTLTLARGLPKRYVLGSVSIAVT